MKGFKINKSTILITVISLLSLFFITVHGYADSYEQYMWLPSTQSQQFFPGNFRNDIIPYRPLETSPFNRYSVGVNKTNQSFTFPYIYQSANQGWPLQYQGFQDIFLQYQYIGNIIPFRTNQYPIKTNQCPSSQSRSFHRNNHNISTHEEETIFTPSISFATPDYIKDKDLSVNHNNELLITFDKTGAKSRRQKIISQPIFENIQLINEELELYKMTIPKDMTMEKFLEQYQDVEDEGLHFEVNKKRTSHLDINDPYYIYQWHLSHISAKWAWDMGTGEDVIVALLDSGVAYWNEEVDDQLFNQEDFPQAKDFTESTFVKGYDFVNNDSYPYDDNSHGTFMAGCITQATNNKVGIASIASGAKIMPIKVMDKDGYVSIADEIQGIVYAVKNGADIINISFGGTGKSHAEQAAIEYAYNNGVTVICSAGNHGSETLEYPASYAHTISVSAVQYDDTLAPYSNFGDKIDICAPGGNLSLDQNLDGWADGILQETYDEVNPSEFRYYFQEGTSPACALVSGVAALVIGRLKSSGNLKKITPDCLKKILTDSAFDLGDPGWDKYYGWGKVDAYYALDQLENYACLEESQTL